MIRPSLLALLAVVASAAPASAQDEAARVRAILQSTPLVDGHNDLPWQVFGRFGGDPGQMDLRADLSALQPPMHTDIARLRQGGVGAQFWSVYVPASLPGPEAVSAVLRQIDLVRWLTATHPDTFEMAYTADDVERIHGQGRIASLIGIEGGNAIDASLPVLREMYRAGARYMTLTHSQTLPWADASTDEARHGGLSPFGVAVVREMNRLGMLVDLSHVSAETMHDALDVSRAPVIFSHSSAFALTDTPRNVPDDVLRRVAETGGVVMVTFVPSFVSQPVRDWGQARTAEMERLQAAHGGDEAAVAAGLAAWAAANPAPRATLAQVADHIEHVRDVAGVAHVGIGSDFDGIESVPEGLDGVEDYPALLAELMRRGWSDAEITALVGGNLLRVMRRAEAVAADLADEPIPYATLDQLDSD